MTHDKQFINGAIAGTHGGETIDRKTAIAICREVGERMRQAMEFDERQNGRLPDHLEQLMSRLRELDDAPPTAPR